MDLYKQSERKFRLEIEGLRAIAALLVAIYHIWFGRVSGGVDVFFVVSGFLITTSLLNRYERNGKIDFFGFILRLAKRLFPAAFSVLLIGTIISFFIIPQIEWEDTIKQIIASALYIENWQLAINSVDYLAQNNAATPFQHFWAMSTQGQFYIIWPALLFISILTAKYLFRKSVRFSFLITLIFILFLSLSYSIYLTNYNQPWAYFDTFTRVWEFSIGGLVALLIANVHLKKGISIFIGWLGLIGLISCGLLLQVSTVFPGYAALWPTMSAVFILIAGNNGGKLGVHRLLGSKTLVKLGGISYGFYLWHWPLLIFYYHLSNNETVPLVHGFIIILLSAILAYLTVNFIEKPIRNLSISKPKTVLFSISCITPVIILASVWGLYSKDLQSNTRNALDYDSDEYYIGALAYVHDNMDSNQDIELDFIPSFLEVKDDIPESYNDGCHQVPLESDVIECEYGDIQNTKYTIALVGGSHSAHWLPALVEFAEMENIKIVNYTKSGCRFTTDFDYSKNKPALDSCEEWNEKLMNTLISKNPDIVFTTANATEKKGIPQGYINKWNTLNEAGIPVFAIRDTPRFSFDVPTCVETNGIDSSKCVIEKDSILPNDIWGDTSIPDNVYYSDLNDYFCEDDTCNPIVGNVLVYRDTNHITATFSRTLAPILKDEIMKALQN